MASKLTRQRPYALTCPTCGGGMREEESAQGPSFACHIGHVFSLLEMDVQQMHAVDQTLAAALRTLNERLELCRRVAASAVVAGNSVATARWSDLQQEVELKAEVLRNLLQRGWADLPEAADDEA